MNHDVYDKERVQYSLDVQCILGMFIIVCDDVGPVSCCSGRTLREVDCGAVRGRMQYVTLVTCVR